jgi:hypothetical protein
VGVAIIFEVTAKREAVSEYSMGVLTRICSEAGVRQIDISSTQRDAQAQARAMYHNCEATGIAAQMRLYRAPGQAVVKTYAACKTKRLGAAQTMAEMERAILEIGPAKVSRHCADPAKINVVDVRPSRLSTADRGAFKAAVHLAIQRGEVSKFLEPPADPAFHIEIPQPEAR